MKNMHNMQKKTNTKKPVIRLHNNWAWCPAFQSFCSVWHWSAEQTDKKEVCFSSYQIFIELSYVMYTLSCQEHRISDDTEWTLMGSLKSSPIKKNPKDPGCLLFWIFAPIFQTPIPTLSPNIADSQKLSLVL